MEVCFWLLLFQRPLLWFVFEFLFGGLALLRQVIVLVSLCKHKYSAVWDVHRRLIFQRFLITWLHIVHTRGRVALLATLAYYHLLVPHGVRLTRDAHDLFPRRSEHKILDLDHFPALAPSSLESQLRRPTFFIINLRLRPFPRQIAARRIIILLRIKATGAALYLAIERCINHPRRHVGDLVLYSLVGLGHRRLLKGWRSEARIGKSWQPRTVRGYGLLCRGVGRVLQVLQILNILGIFNRRIVNRGWLRWLHVVSFDEVLIRIKAWLDELEAGELGDRPRAALELVRRCRVDANVLAHLQSIYGARY